MNDMAWSRWSDDRVNEMTRLWQQNMTLEEIAATIGVTKAAVKDKASRVGLARPIRAAVDKAEAWIIENPTATYRDAALLHGVTINNIRARIANKYGSLPAARIEGPTLANRDSRRVLKAVRRCFRCGRSSSIEVGRRMCNCCALEVEGIHDGGV